MKEDQPFDDVRTSPSMLPPIMNSSLSFCGKHGSSLTARARLERGPRATRDTCRENVGNPTPDCTLQTARSPGPGVQSPGGSSR